ncbi:MAG: hypothetical protein PHS82_13775 [Lachnospiraceae bacterium]|nr:hypothetical protein [Lachnospiraceae bacterium]
MGINNKKNHLSHISVYIIMLLFTMCVTMGVFFCCNYNPYDLLNKTTANETWTTSESVIVNGDVDKTTDFRISLLNKNNSYDENQTKNVLSILLIAVIPQGIGLLLYLAIVFLFILATFFILLPDGWSLINQKVRLDN